MFSIEIELVVRYAIDSNGSVDRLNLWPWKALKYLNIWCNEILVQNFLGFILKFDFISNMIFASC